MAERNGSRYCVQFGTGAPWYVQLPNKSIAAKSPVAAEGLIGLPERSTDGFAFVALALSTPGQYRKIPARAKAVNVLPAACCRLMSRSPSNNRKKNVLFF